MKKYIQRSITLGVLIAASVYTYGQTYNDYLGGGHNNGVVITSSSSVSGTSPDNTFNGLGMNSEYMAASRFLGQATMGANRAEIKKVLDIGSKAWIDQQFETPASLLLPQLNAIMAEIRSKNPDAYGPGSVHFNYAWWQTNMTNNDLLRQKVAYALSQILVVSSNSDLDGGGDWMASYYDIFINRAFDNYRDILLDVTRHPAMGYYLSHINNPKTDTILNIRPDENFAREVMQLFSIGLFELNMDGSRRKDANGQAIPTYNNKDIKEMAKIFTGMYGIVRPCPDEELPAECACYGSDNPAYCDSLSMTCCWWPKESGFGYGTYVLDGTQPMKMSENDHEPGPKRMPDGTIIEVPGNGMAEVEQAIEYLFNHPNTGPFIAYRLIQRIVKSNPTPGYVARVAMAFNDNGQGVRGDMQAVITAILLDKEAWEKDDYFDHAPGKLREPFLRYVQMSRTFPNKTDQNRYWYNGYYLRETVKQHVLAAPSVFNFYLPTYQPAGDITSAGLVAPEFKLHNTATSIAYINLIHQGLFNNLLHSWEDTSPDPDAVYLDLDALENICNDAESLINELDILLTHGQLTDETRHILRETLDAVYWNTDSQYKYYRVRLAIFLIMISPDYTCVR